MVRCRTTRVVYTARSGEKKVRSACTETIFQREKPGTGRDKGKDLHRGRIRRRGETDAENIV